MEEEKKYIKGIALVVGINDYENTTKLDNAVFDANSIADSLERLCFYTLKYNNVNIDEFDDALSDFVERLKDFDVGVFYYAGHGIELEGENYLLSQNTPCDRVEGVKRYSMKLQDVVDKMNKTSCKTKILIIDACRNNPFPVDRGFGTTNLAPIFAPQGTLIAYSTSPGQKSLDGGIGIEEGRNHVAAKDAITHSAHKSTKTIHLPDPPLIFKLAIAILVVQAHICTTYFVDHPVVQESAAPLLKHHVLQDLKISCDGSAMCRDSILELRHNAYRLSF